jgi:hypothetical protein
LAFISLILMNVLKNLFHTEQLIQEIAQFQTYTHAISGSQT